MAATILQYEGSMVAPKDDAILYHMMNEQAGVVKGCSITYLGTNQIRLGAGYVYVCGRLVKIDEEIVLSPFADEAGAAGELILKIDLLSDTPAKVLARTPRQELVQTDINGEGAVYEYLLASYTVTDVVISGLTIEYTVASAAIPQDRLLSSLEEIALVTEPGYVVDALAVKSLNTNITNKFQAPDYTNKQVISSNTYTVTEDGYVALYVHKGNNGVFQSATYRGTLTINGTVVWYYSNTISSNEIRIYPAIRSGLYPVKAGDTVKFSVTNADSYERAFFPAR